MCGIHGAVAVKYDRNLDDYIKDAFVAGSLRGMDSSGIAQIYSDDSFETHKLPIRGSYFITDKAATHLLNQANQAGTATICHTRAATVGSISRNTAHPFEAYDTDDNVLVGVHNGTLTNWRSKAGATKFDVDSEWALNHIQKERLDAFEDFTGAFCFVWWDSRDKDTLNIARNSERPMHVVMLESGGMAYASEAGMLYWLLERRDVKMAGPIIALDEGYWYKFPMDNPANFSKTALPETKHYTYTPPTTSHTRTYVSAMDKVRDLFKSQNIPVTPAPLTSGESRKSALVSQEEYDAARNLQWLNEAAAFSPYMIWGGNIEGSVQYMGAELEAVLRGYSTNDFDMHESWKVKIVGVEDDGQRVAAVVILTPAQRAELTKASNQSAAA